MDRISIGMLYLLCRATGNYSRHRQQSAASEHKDVKNCVTRVILKLSCGMCLCETESGKNSGFSLDFVIFERI